MLHMKKTILTLQYMDILFYLKVLEKYKAFVILYAGDNQMQWFAFVPS